MKTEIDLKKPQNIYFSGIGGIGISAIARMMLLGGKKVTGSDHSESKVTEELQKLGATIFPEHKQENIPEGCDLLVYTHALAKDNPELVEAKQRKIPMLSYPETLHLISKEKFTIAVAGTHGKTTTTAMVAKILLDAKLDPTVIVGSLLSENSSNLIVGKSDLFVVEADEYRRSFLNLEPKILAITNLDEDHLDYYKDLAEIQSVFHELAMRIPKTGFLICDTNNPHLAPVIEGLQCVVLNYADMAVEDWQMKVPGEHNRQNAKVAAVVGGVLGVSESQIKKSLEHFEGTWRRFEFKGESKKGVLVYDDYAHNPQKVRAALAGARELFPKKKIWAIFQPHLFSRTKHSFADFTVSFGNADEIVLAPIFAAREKVDPSITSGMLALEIVKQGGKAKYAEDFSRIVDYIQKNAKKGDVVMTVGAGDIYKVGEELLK